MSDRDPSAIARQLQALGEAPPSDDELRLELALDDDADVAALAALIELSQPLEGAGPLTDIERARAWRRVEARLGDGGPARARKGGTSGRPWALIATGLAAAAVVTFILVRPGPAPEGSSEDEHAAAIAMGEQARAGLGRLGVKPGAESARAQDMLRDYEARLGAEGAG